MAYNHDTTVNPSQFNGPGQPQYIYHDYLPMPVVAPKGQIAKLYKLQTATHSDHAVDLSNHSLCMLISDNTGELQSRDYNPKP